MRSGQGGGAGCACEAASGALCALRRLGASEHDARELGWERSGNTALQDLETRETHVLPPSGLYALFTGQGRVNPACCRPRRGGRAHLELNTAQGRYHGRGPMLFCAEWGRTMFGSCHWRHGDGGGLAASRFTGYGSGSPTRCHRRGCMCSALAGDMLFPRVAPGDAGWGALDFGTTHRSGRMFSWRAGDARCPRTVAGHADRMRSSGALPLTGPFALCMDVLPAKRLTG